MTLCLHGNDKEFRIMLNSCVCFLVKISSFFKPCKSLHKIKTPISGIIAFAETIQGINKNQRFKDDELDLKLKANSGRWLSYMINDTRDFLMFPFYCLKKLSRQHGLGLGQFSFFTIFQGL